MFDREQLFQLLHKKEWGKIAKIMSNNPEQLRTDPIFAQAISLFETEFFIETDKLSTKGKTKAYLYPNLVIEMKEHGFSKSFVRDFIARRLNLLKESGSENLISYASGHQNHPAAVKILSEIQKEKPETLANARRQHTSVKTTKTNNGKPLTISLFKSAQEKNFFEAIRDAYPTYYHYPNVAVSCLIDFDAIKSGLSKKERDYFFRAIVDAVVFDSMSKDYEAKYYFELDSVYHDIESAAKNDRMKDAIFSAANIKLIRIRPHKGSEATVRKFKELVMEITRV